MRLNRYLAACGLASRRKAEAIIEGGRVVINGKQVKELATFVDTSTDKVEVDGRVLTLPDATLVLLLYKPEGVVTTAFDPEGRPTVMQLVPESPRLFPIGRLDVDTSGALLMTNDGTLSHRIQHPRYKLEKEYRVMVTGIVADETLTTLRDGMWLPGERRPTAPAKVEILDRRGNRTHLTLVIREGRNRQIRRMMEAVEHPVLSLKRVRIGPLRLGEMEEGTFRELTEEELTKLRKGPRGGRRRNRQGRAG